MKPKAFNFEFSPNLITLLGEQLIHDKKIAVSELVKNAYDADASEVEIAVINSQIIITDNGCGMGIDTIKNIWLKPGVSSKKTNIEKGERTPKFHRMPIGEKGVGRLGSHKLGSVIELYTKSENQEEIHLKIDWNKLEQSSSLAEMPPIDVSENKTNVIQTETKTGTKIIIAQLKEVWTDEDIKTLSNDLTNLIAPFSSQDNFDIILKKDNELFDNNLKEQAEKIKKNALFNFDITINNGCISQFNYQFKPWRGLEKVDGRKININNDLNLLKNILGKKNELINFKQALDKYKNLNIGEVNFSGFVYDFDNILFGIQKQMLTSEKKPTKDYLKNNGGIRVYRDDFRIFNYGEPGNDFFALDAKRVQRTSGHISSNQILGSIKLKRKDSTGLIEKTNREGFINNDAFSALQDMLSETFKIIDQLRALDKDKIMRMYLENAEDRASVESKISDIKDTINKSDLEQKEKEKINKNLESFSKDFAQTKEIFMNAANAGLSLSIVVHELERIINNLDDRIKEQNWEEVPNIAKYLQTTVNAYKDTIKIEKKTSIIGIDEVVKKSIFNVSARFSFHKIKIISELDQDLNVSVKKNLIIGVINNVFDNAIYWLDYQGVKNQEILIKSYKKDKQIHLLIADNGKGFTIDFDSATRPFITGRRDDTSMGIGLHLANTIMDAHQGFLVQGDFDEEKLPKEFKNGAIVKLIFKEVENV